MNGIRRKWLALLTLTSLVPVGAVSMPLPLTEQAKKAEVIVRAMLGTAQVVKDGDVTYLAYPLEIRETVVGNVDSLPKTEGKPSLMFLQGLEDAPVLSAGQDAVLLLYARRLDSPVVGVNQGVYVVKDGKVSAGDVTDPAKLLEAIRAARGIK